MFSKGTNHLPHPMYHRPAFLLQPRSLWASKGLGRRQGTFLPTQKELVRAESNLKENPKFQVNSEKGVLEGWILGHTGVGTWRWPKNLRGKGKMDLQRNNSPSRPNPLEFLGASASTTKPVSDPSVIISPAWLTPTCSRNGATWAGPEL